MKKVIQILLINIFLLIPLVAQDNGFGIKFSGFVKSDMMFDTRQTVNAREGHLLLYPKNEVLDFKGEDINENANFNILSIQTRLKGAIVGPKAFGAKTSGVIEAAFFGHSNSDINGFRLRHAFIKLDWGKSSLLVGQYWHPMFVTEVFPGVVSFNTGMPMAPFSRNPQIKFTQKVNSINISLSALSQRDFTSISPVGGSNALRNSGLPIMDLTVKHISKSFVLGAGANYKSLLPRLHTISAVDSLPFKSDEKINSISFMGFAKVVTGNFTFKVEGVMGENLSDMLMLGGYAVSKYDPATGAEEYTNIKTFSGWTEFIYQKNALQLGIFFGYTKNLGADDDIVGEYFSRGSDIASVMRVSPRIVYTVGKTRFATEVEYTAADYGTPDSKGEVENTTTVSNIRVLLAGYLFF